MRETWQEAFTAALAAGDDAGQAARNAWHTTRMAAKERRAAMTTTSKGLALNAWQDQVRDAFKKQHGGLFPISIHDDHLVAVPELDDEGGLSYADRDVYWRIPYTFERQMLADEATETVGAVVFADRGAWQKVYPTYAAMKLFEQDGRHRWVAVSSGAYQDFDGEWVSSAFLDDAIATAEKIADRGELWVAHVPGTRIGSCDYQALHEGFLLESGLLDETPIAETARQYMEKTRGTGVSITFAFKHRSPTGVYSPPGLIVERSILPPNTAAFPWSSITSLEISKMATITPTKRRALADILGEDVADAILNGMTEQSKALEAAGLRFKAMDEVIPIADAAEAEAVDPGVLESYETDFVLSDEAIAGIAEKIAGTMSGSIRQIVQSVVSEEVSRLRPDIDALRADFQTLAAAEDERIAEKVRDLPRGTVRRIVRPTEAVREKAADPQAPKEDALLAVGLQTLYG